VRDVTLAYKKVAPVLHFCGETCIALTKQTKPSKVSLGFITSFDNRE